MDTAQGYSLAQLCGLPTILSYREFVRKTATSRGRPRSRNRLRGQISRQLFMGDYTAIDINPDYIAKAKGHLSGQFYVMNAAMLPFAPNSFDDAVCIATAHHLSDAQLAAMVSKAVIVARTLHIIDAILPLSPKAIFKRTLFQMDRGRFVRTLSSLCTFVGRPCGR